MTTQRTIERQRRDWEEVAGFNPEWAVLTDSAAKREGWEMEPFLRSGEVQIQQVSEAGQRLGLPARKGSALDFGCGVGRLAPPLSREYERYVGVDISEPMIERARALHADRAGCSFVLNASADLGGFEDDSFDAVVSFLVLQHMTDRAMIRTYLSEMVRVLAPGGLIAVQLVSHVPPIYRLRVRRRLYRLARGLRVSVERAHRWGLQSMVLTAIGVDEVLDLFQSAGAEVRDHKTQPAQQGVLSTTYYVTV